MADALRPSVRIGVNSGGTFTDICIFDPSNDRLSVWKVSSTPNDPSVGILEGIVQGLAESGLKPADVVYFGHGTTVATNALIQNRLAKTGVITTKGFRDVLEIGRQRRPRLYDTSVERMPAIAARDLRFEVDERVRFDGSIETPVDLDQVREAVRCLRSEGVTAIAICFLFSFLMPEHEKAAEDVVRQEFPDVFVSLSSVVAPEIREYERFSTVAINAALGPVMKTYLDGLEPGLRKAGIEALPYLTQSNGGIISARLAAQQPVRTVLSGPAAGVMAALSIGEAAGYPNLITFDMGGTSSDVALIDKGQPQLSLSAEVHDRPLKVPMLDIHTVGAGGGSIASVDAGGLLKVGPRSAGANPGPVCYGLGNEEPTVTDANVVLGILNPMHLLNGRMPIHRQPAFDAIDRLARRIGLDTMAAAQGIISVVTANMAKAIRVISVERGYDPRDYVLMAFGGAGPLHAARLARELDMKRVLVPRNPGIACAMGLLLNDPKTHFSLGRLLTLNVETLVALADGFSTLEAQARAWFDQEGIPSAGRVVNRFADMRYAGQGHELIVNCPSGALDSAAFEVIKRRFEETHTQVYGFAAAAEALEVVTLRVEAIGHATKATIEEWPPAQSALEQSVVAHRDVWLTDSGGYVSCPIYDREMLGPGHIIRGPAIIEQMDSTTFVLEDQTATVDPWLNIIVENTK